MSRAVRMSFAVGKTVWLWHGHETLWTHVQLFFSDILDKEDKEVPHWGVLLGFLYHSWSPALKNGLVWRNKRSHHHPFTHPPTSFWVDLGSLSLASTPNFLCASLWEESETSKNVKKIRLTKFSLRKSPGKKVLIFLQVGPEKIIIPHPIKRYPNHNNELVLPLRKRPRVFVGGHPKNTDFLRQDHHRAPCARVAS